MLVDEFGPILGSGEVVVGHPPLDAPGCFEIALPGLALLDLHLADAQSPVDGLRPVREGDGAGVGDEGLGRTILLYRPVEDSEESIEVLPASQRAGEHSPRVVLQYCDGVDHAFGEQAFAEHVQVAYVRGPILVVPLGSEGHRFLCATTALRFLAAVDLAHLGEDSPAGGAAQVEAFLLEGNMDPECADLWILRQLPDLLDGREGHLPHPGGPSVRFVLKPLRAFFLEPLQNLVDGRASDTQVAGDGLRGPAAHAQLHDGCSAFAGVHLVEAGVVPLQLKGPSCSLENTLYGAHIGLSTEAGIYYVGYLVEVERRVFCLEVHDEPADVGWELALPSRI